MAHNAGLAYCVIQVSNAIDEGSVDKTRFWLQFMTDRGVDLDKVSPQVPLVYFATCAKSTEIVKLMVGEFRMDVDKQTYNGATPIMLATIQGDEDMVRVLAEELRADVNKSDKNGQGAINRAVFSGHLGLARALTSRFGATVPPPDKYGRTLLHKAVESKSEAMVRFVAGELGVDVNKKDSQRQAPIYFAVKLGLVEVVRILCRDFGADASNCGGWNSSVLEVAIDNKDKAMLEVLTSDCKLDPHGRPCVDAMEKALRLGDGGAVLKLLVRALGVDVDKAIMDHGTQSVLFAALTGKDCTMVKVLVEELGADVDKPLGGNTSLSMAADHGTEEMVRYLALECGVDANAADAKGVTIASKVARRWGGAAGLRLLRMLVHKCNADVHRTDKFGVSPIWMAARRGHPDVMKLLVLEYGADPLAASNEEGLAPIHAAARRNCNNAYECMKLLLEFGEDANRANGECLTPLAMIAGKHFRGRFVQLLVSQGARRPVPWLPKWTERYRSDIDAGLASCTTRVQKAMTNAMLPYVGESGVCGIIAAYVSSTFEGWLANPVVPAVPVVSACRVL